MTIKVENDFYDSADAEFFRQVVLQLQNNNIHFWLEGGALLGLVRDGRFMDWDKDIDIAVWAHETTEMMLIKAFDQEPFILQSRFYNQKSSAFVFSQHTDVQRKIDVVFYNLQGDRAVHQSYIDIGNVVNVSILDSLAAFGLECLKTVEPDNTLQHSRFIKKFKNRVFKSAVLVLKMIPENIKQAWVKALYLWVIENSKKAWLQNSKNFEKTPVIYDFPAIYFQQLNKVEILGVQVNIPDDAEGFLQTSYGVDWQTPKQWQNWYEGASNIKEIKLL